MEYETKTQVTETHVQTNLRWDPGYIKTVPGGLKTAGVLLSLVCFLCAMCAPPHLKEQPLGEWFIFTAMTAFWVSAVLLIMYLVHAIEKFHVIPWLMIEFGFCALWSFFFFTAALAFAVEVSGSNIFLLKELSIQLCSENPSSVNCMNASPLLE